MLTLLFLVFVLGLLCFGAHALYLIIYAGLHPGHVAVQFLVIVLLFSLSHAIHTMIQSSKADSSTESNGSHQ